MLTPKTQLVRRSNLEFSVNLTQRRQWYAETEADADADATATKTDGKGDGKTAEDDIQKRMDALAGNVRKEATAAARKALLKELGLDPDDPKAVDTVKGKLTAAQQAEEAQKTEAQKLQDKIASLEAKSAAAEAKAAEAEQKRKDAILDTRLETLASKVGAQFPDDVINYARRNYADKVTALMDDSGKIDEKKAGELIEEIKKARPNFFDMRKGAGTGSHGGGRTEPVTDKATERRVAIMSQRNTRG